MQIVGMTNEHEVWAASGNRKFRLNELLIIEDDFLNYPVGEVIETYAINPFIPAVDEHQPVLVDNEVIDALSNMGYEINREMIYAAKLRILSELFYPVKTGAVVREPAFAEVSNLLVKASPGKGLTLGVIMGSEGLDATLPEEFRGLSPLYDNRQGLLPQHGVPFIFDYRAMSSYPHMGIFGGSGSGKSFGLRVIIEELIERRVPLLVFDPHYEMSFADVFDENLPASFKANFDRNCTILTVGTDIGVRFDSLNAGDLCNLLSAVSPLSEAMENAVATLLETKDSLAVFQDRLDSMIQLLESSSEEDYREQFMQRRDIEDKKKNSYWNKLIAMKKQVGQLSTLKSLSWRLNRLRYQGIFMDQGIRKIEEGLKAQKAVIIRGSIWMLKVYAAYVLRTVYTKRRDYRDAVQKGTVVEEKFPPFVIITDEAHNFASRGEHNVPSRREIREISQEGRKYGVFLVLATQRPALLDDTVNAQLNTKLIFRTVRSTDLAVIREETDIGSEEIKRLPYLPSGTGYISSPIFGRTMSLRIRVAKTRSPHQINPFDELEAADDNQEEIQKVIWECLPVNESNLVDILMRLENRGIRISEAEVVNLMDKMTAGKQLIRKDNPIVGFTYSAPE